MVCVLGSLEILSIQPPSKTVVSPKQSKGKSRQGKKQTQKADPQVPVAQVELDSVADSAPTSERSENASTPEKGPAAADTLPRRKLLPGNGLHSWRAFLFAQVMEIDPTQPVVKVRLADGFEFSFKRNYRLRLQQWEKLTVGSYYKLGVYPWVNREGLFWSGLIYRFSSISESEFDTAQEEWHLVAFFRENKCLVQRDTKCIARHKPLKCITVVPDGLDKYSDLERGVYRVPVKRNGVRIAMAGPPEIELAVKVTSNGDRSVRHSA